MPSVKVISRTNEQVGEVNLPDALFDVEVKPHLLHQVVQYQLAKKRAGTASTKTRGQIRGSGKKPYRQKGTGRARAGSRKSPIWRGGGTIFGPHPRDYSFKINKKVRQQALAGALTMKLKDGDLILLDSFGIDQIKTKEMIATLGVIDATNCLIIIGNADEKVEKSARNIPGVKVLRTEGLNVYDCLNHQRLVILTDAVEKIEQRFN